MEKIENLLENIEQKSEELAIKDYIELGFYYVTGKKNIFLAKQYLEKAVDLSKEHQDNTSLANAYNGLGLIARYNSQFHLAFQFYTEALQLFLDLDLQNKQSAVYNNLGVLCSSMKDYEKSIKYFKKGIVYYENEPKFLKQTSSIYKNIGLSYTFNKNYEEALKYFQKSLENLNPDTEELFYAKMLQGLGFYYQETDSLEKAKTVYEEVLDSFLKHNALEQVLDIKVRLLSINIAQKQVSDFKIKIQEIETLVKAKYNFSSKKDILQLYIDYYELTGNYKEAFLTQKELKRIKKEEKTKSVLKSIQQYELDKELNSLNERNKDLVNFSRILSHDLKEPLRIINQFSNILTKKSQSENSEDDIFLKEISAASNHMNQMIDDLLDYTKLDSKTYKSEQIDLHTLFESVKAMLQIKIKDANASIETSTEKIVIQSSQTLLFQLLQNLISNGIKYNDKEFPKITIDSSIEEQFCVIRITDNGIGIKEEMIPHIFEPFKRVHKNKFEAEGTGIGLSICKRILEKLKGTIEVTSTVGKGSCFTIKISANIKQA